MTTSKSFNDIHLFPYTLLGYYVLVNGQVFTGVSGRRMWQTKRAASRMLNYTLKQYNLNRNDFTIEFKPIINYTDSHQ